MQPPVIFWEKSCGLTQRMTMLSHGDNNDKLIMLSGDNNDTAKW